MMIQYRVTTGAGKSLTYNTRMQDVVGAFEDHHHGLKSLGMEVEILSPIPAHHLQCTIAAAEFRSHSHK